jgi:hypothetical protein
VNTDGIQELLGELRHGYRVAPAIGNFACERRALDQRRLRRRLAEAAEVGGYVDAGRLRGAVVDEGIAPVLRVLVDLELAVDEHWPVPARVQRRRVERRIHQEPLDAESRRRRRCLLRRVLGW